jgi:hypothetical protein
MSFAELRSEMQFQEKEDQAWRVQRIPGFLRVRATRQISARPAPERLQDDRTVLAGVHHRPWRLHRASH